MDSFVSHFTHRLDAKGRVSVPAGFRAVMARDGFEGLYVYPALDRQALDAGGNALRASIDMILGRFSPFSEEWELLSVALNGASELLKMDAEGRIQLPDVLKAHAGINDAVTFVGQGHKFQIWEPERFQAHFAQARLKLRDVRQMLSSGALVPGVASGGSPGGTGP
jgi:MraZ protein